MDRRGGGETFCKRIVAASTSFFGTNGTQPRNITISDKHTMNNIPSFFLSLQMLAPSPVSRLDLVGRLVTLSYFHSLLVSVGPLGLAGGRLGSQDIGQAGAQG